MIEDILPLSPLQEGFLFHSLYASSERDVYTVQMVASLEGAVAVDRLRVAAQALLRRHDALRAGVWNRDGRQPVQFIASDVTLPFTAINLTDRDEAARASFMREWLATDASTRFNLARPPLLRLALITLDARHHRLVLTNHHILLDGWSVPIVLKDLLTLYEREGDSTGLPPVTRQREYAAWLAAQDRAAAQSEWRDALQELSTSTQIASPDHTLTPSRPEHVGLDLDEALSGALTQLARRLGATLSTVIHAAWAIVLSRVSGRDDVVFGTTVAGRPPQVPGIESMVGCFINTLPVRLCLKPSMTFAALVRRAREWQGMLLAHACLSLAEIQRLVGLSPLFDTLVLVENYPIDSNVLERTGGSLDVRRLQFFGSNHYPLSVIVLPGASVQLRLEYRGELLDRAVVEGLSSRLLRLFEAVVRNPEIRIGQLDLIPACMRRQVLEDWSRGPRVDASATLLELIQAQAQNTPEAIAITCEHASISYGMLLQRATHLASLMTARGVRNEDVVAVALPPCIDVIVALLGIMKAGAVYCPLEVHHPPQRLQALLDDAAPRALITTAATAWLCPKGATCLPLDAPSFRQEWDRVPADTAAPVAARLRDQAAYAIYTSGSTGRPKRVIVTHRGLATLAAAQVEAFSVYPCARVLQVAAPGFDASVSEIAMALITGAVLVLARDGQRSGPGLVDAVATHQITHLTLTPSVLATVDEGTLRSIQTLIVAGEACPASLVARWSAGRRMVNAYGPTETTVCATMSAPLGADGAAPLGRPIWNTRVYVLDEALEPVPVGVVGELYVAGPGLARSYGGQPGLTATHFVADPYGAAGTRMYRTGDRARWQPDGVVAFVGRMDAQVKLRGIRVELGEIEAALRADERVQEAVVTVVGEGEQRRLYGYVVPVDGTRADGPALSAALHARLAAQLPAALVPVAIESLAAWPQTRSGKVDRQALPVPTAAAGGPSGGPRTPDEEVLCGLFAEVLQVQQVGLDDDFFARGGHSLLATQLVSRIRATLGGALEIGTVFDAPTVRRLTPQVRGGGPRPALRSGPRPARLPASAGQQRLWFLAQLHGTSTAYHAPAALTLTGALDAAALEAALTALAGRHESLRTHLAEVDGTVVQVIAPPGPVQVRREDLRGLAASVVAARVQAALQEEITTSLPTAGPQWRVRLLQVAAEQHVLLWTVHHLIADGWSAGVLRRDLWALYEAARTGQPAALPPLPVQYADYALWEQAEQMTAAVAASRAYWERQLAGAPAVLALPTAQPRPARPTGTAGLHVTALPPAVSAALARVQAGQQATWHMTLLAALAVVLARASGQPEVVIGTPVAYRPLPVLEDVVGFFVHTLPVRVPVPAAATLRAVLAATRRTLLEAYQHQAVPLEWLVAAGGGPRQVDTPPLVQVVFALEYLAPAVAAPPSLTVAPVAPAHAQVRFDLEVHAAVQGETVTLSWLYRAALFTPVQIAAWAAAYVTLLTAFAEALDPPVRDVLTLAPEERAARLAWGAAPATPPPPASTLPAWFAAQVARTPDAIALVAGVTALSYAALDAQAARLAHVLRQHGVGPEAVVGVALPRSLELLVALLAVVKAGGAYLPLDPAYPAARLAWLMTDAKPACVVMSAATTGPWTGDVPTLVIDAPATQAALRAAPDRCAPVALAPQAAAYVMYTSGSTGTPKGVVVSHAAVVRLVWPPTYATLASDCVLLQLAPLSFDASTFEIWGAWLHGARLVLAAETRLTLTALRHCLQTEGVTTLWLTAGWFHVLVQEAIDALAGLRELLAGGDVLGAADVQRLQTALPHVQVINGYGPTEATTFTCCYAVRPGDGARGAIPLGRPIGGTRVAVLDAQLDPMPRGLAGELYIGGAGLARGYLGQAARTAERFIADPTGPAGARLYRTGDRAQWQPDGTLAFLGRVDDQVKLRGYRVEPGEIAAALEALPGVARAVVVAQHDATTVLHLVGYVVAQPGHLLTPAALREALAARVPDYLVPAAIVVLAALPLTPHGKIDRHALPRAIPRLGVSSRSLLTPREIHLADVFTEVLGIDDVGPDDDFFELGGHSILALKAVHRAQDRLGQEISLQAFFAHPSVRRLAAHLDSGRSGGPPERVLALRTSGELPPLFCLPPGGGLAWSYAAMLGTLRRVRSVYGIQASHLSDESSFPDSVEEFAGHYLSAIRQLHPQGPYHLLGTSFGGLVGFEIACRLQHIGADVRSLTIVDAYPPAAWDERPVEQEDPDRLRARLMAEGAGVMGNRVIARMCALIDHAAKIVPAYHPGCFNGDILLLASEEGAPLAHAWAKHANGAVFVRSVCRAHSELLRGSTMRLLGECVDAHLATAEDAARVQR